MSNTDYDKTLQNLPEPLRSQLLFGDFTIGLQDGAFQTIPTEWVRMAQDRWKNMQRPPLAMIALGVDVARGGEDKTVLAPLIGNWFAALVKAPGTSTPDGRAVVGLVVETIKDDAIVFVDSIGVGASVYDMLRRDNFRAVPLNFAAHNDQTHKTGAKAHAKIRP